jgi:hypothetical protein
MLVVTFRAVLVVPEGKEAPLPGLIIVAEMFTCGWFPPVFTTPIFTVELEVITLLDEF